MFSETELNLQESELREQIRDLSPAQRAVYGKLETDGLKDASRYLTLNCLFALGVHHFYLGRWLRGTVNLMLTLAGLWLLFFSDTAWYGVLMLIAVVLIEIPQLLNARLLVRNRNNQIMRDCLWLARQSPENEVSES